MILNYIWIAFFLIGFIVAVFRVVAYYFRDFVMSHFQFVLYYCRQGRIFGPCEKHVR